MTARIREFLRNACRRRALPRRRSRRRPRELSRLRQGVAGHQGVLRGQGEPGARGARAPRRARLQLRHRLGRRDRDGARGRRHGGPHLLRQHHQEGARHRARLCARRAPVRRRLRRRGREGRPRRARRARLLPHPLRLRRGGMAAVAQVRLRAGHGGRRAGACPSPRPRSLWRLVPCRLPAAQSACLGPRARLGGGGVPRMRRARPDARAWSISAAASRPSTSRTCRR